MNAAQLSHLRHAILELACLQAQLDEFETGVQLDTIEVSVDGEHIGNFWLDYGGEGSCVYELNTNEDDD